MDKELRILILEDSPADAELEEHELRKAGLVFISKVVDTKESFMKELDKFSPDLILSDYELPAFDGLAALRITKKKCPDVPFILVSGKVGEEFAIEKLKEGATDYVLKNNLKRLVPSVNRALQEAEESTDRKRLRRELQESEKKYRLLAENTHDMITRHLPDGTYIYVSPVCRTLFGYEPEELIGTNAFKQMHPDDVKRVMSITQEALRTDGSDVAQYRHRTKDGQYIWVETACKIIKNRITREIEDIICVVRDITARKQAEDLILGMKRDWENIFQAIGHPTIILDAQHNILSVNRATVKAAGAGSADELIGRKCYEIFHNAGEPPEGCPLEKMLATRKLEASEMEVEAFGGIYFVSCTPVLDEKGGLQKIIHIATDITERKRMVENLKYEHSLLTAALDSTADGILIVDRNGKVTGFNQKFLELWRIPESLTETHDDNLLLNFVFDQLDDPEAFLKKVKELYQTPEASSFDDIIFRDGRTFERYSQPQRIGETIEGRVWSFRDITERKQSEKEIKMLSSVVQQSTEGMAIADLDGILSFVNEAWCKMHGYKSPEELLGNNLDISHNQEQMESEVRPFNEKVMKLGSYSGEVGHITKDGKPFPTLMVTTLLKDKQGKPYALAAIAKDITDHKRVDKEIQNKVKELEDFYNIAVGRELRMIKLKEEIEELKTKLKGHENP